MLFTTLSPRLSREEDCVVSMQLARRLTLRLHRLRAAQPVVEAIQRRSARFGVQEVADFDGNLRIALDLCEQAASDIFWCGYHRPGVVRCLDGLLGPGQVLFDVGARIGEVTLVAAKRVGPSGAVFAFEAQAAQQRKLAANVAANRLNQVRYVPCDAGAAPGTRPVEARAGRFFGEARAGAGPRGAATLRAEVTTIDAVAGQYRLERLDGIRLGGEGRPLAALRGAASSLARFAPWLVVEGVPAQADLAALLPGYRFHRIRSDGEVATLDAPGAGEALLGLPVARA
ncbi:methyltransferase FkbM family [Methylobacterium sp. 4-46]|nr:methyltransferase FkbM family [Methylobacterium sp. 4-46]